MISTLAALSLACTLPGQRLGLTAEDVTRSGTTEGACQALRKVWPVPLLCLDTPHAQLAVVYRCLGLGQLNHVACRRAVVL